MSVQFQDLSIKNKILSFIQQEYKFLIALLIVLGHLGVYYLYGIYTPVGIHDNFDSTIVWYKVLVESGKIFAAPGETIPNIMDGIPRICFGSEFYALIWLFAIFDPFTAYLVNLTIMHLVGFIGMFALLNTHILKNHEHELISLGVAMCFAILPFWPSGGLSVASLPLSLYAFLNIRNENATKKDWIILSLIPFYSSVVFSYSFFLALLGILWLYDSVKTKQPNYRFLGAIILMTAIFLIVEYRLILGMLSDTGFTTHRVEFTTSTYSLQESLDTALKVFITGIYHSPSFHGSVIFLAIAISVAVIVFSYSKAVKKGLLIGSVLAVIALSIVMTLSSYESVAWRLYYFLSDILINIGFPIGIIGLLILAGVMILFRIIWIRKTSEGKISLESFFGKLTKVAMLLIICGLFSLWYGFWYWIGWLPLKEQFEILRIYMFSRFYWLQPLFWYILFAVSLSIIDLEFDLNHKRVGKYLVIVILAVQLVFVYPYHYGVNLFDIEDPDRITYAEFFAEEQFAQIRDDIGLNQEDYRIINIGIHPAISQYNGFYTLDGYFNNYPVEYKHKFRNIIAYELEKNEVLKNYFDEWGSRCYTYVAELGKGVEWTKEKNMTISNLELNITALYEMNCQFVFSSVRILNIEQNNLELMNIYEHELSAWRMFVYQVQ